MLKTIVVLPDGTELISGVGTKNAVKSIALTQCVNEGQELTLGSACSKFPPSPPEADFPLQRGMNLRFTGRTRKAFATRWVCLPRKSLPGPAQIF